jgi:putative transposase
MLMLERVVEKHKWRCHAYCLMTNHFHLLVETPEPNISAGMHQLNFRHAQWINWRYGFSGHVFDRRFNSVVIQSDPHFAELTRYIVLNPERAHLCARAIDWRWSSLRATLGLEERPSLLTTERVLRQFADDVCRARELYRIFIDAARAADDENGRVRGQAPAVAA